MLPKKNRAGTKAIQKIFTEGRILSYPNLIFRFRRTAGKEKRISFIAPKSVAKLAVTRTSLRRLGYTVLKKYIDMFPAGTIGVFSFKTNQKSVLILEHEIKNILAKIN
jgi:RNase P protein component